MKLLAFCEAAADHRIAAALIDRVLFAEGPAWVAAGIQDTPDAIRSWRVNHFDQRTFFKIHNVNDYARELDLRLPHGRFDGKPGGYGAIMAMTAFAVARKVSAMGEAIDVVVLVWDMDDQGNDRRQGLSRARDAAAAMGFQIVLGCPDAKREAWVLSGFVADDDDESQRLEQMRAALGFSPVTASHELYAADETAKRSAKRVLRELTDGDDAREERCWMETPLDVLRTNGATNGLAAYLDEVEKRLLPLCT